MDEEETKTPSQRLPTSGEQESVGLSKMSKRKYANDQFS